MNGTAPESRELTFEAEVLRVTFERDDSTFRVIKVQVAGRNEPVSVIGHFPRVGVGAHVRIRGVPEVDRKHGDQIRALAVTELGPRTLKGLARYLASGVIRGVGKKTAERMVDTFGMKTLEILDEHPERLAEVQGISKNKAQQIARAWKAAREVREVMVILQGYGVSIALADRIFRRYGPNAVHVVSEQPYRLAMEVRGIGFATADKIAQQVGIARDAPERIQAGLLQALSDATEGGGHTCVPFEALVEAARALLGGAETEALERALRALLLSGHVIEEKTLEGSLYFTRPMHGSEVRLAERLLELASAHVRPIGDVPKLLEKYEKDRGIQLAPEQRQAVERAAHSPLLVITGGPGVGKTTVVRALLALFDAAKVPVRLAAPTGRAAKRMQEAAGRDAQTLHRLLEFDPKRAAFQRMASRPIEAGAVIVDEASMIDLPLADSLTQAVAPGTRLLLVGDVDQLPSVGPGAVLRDVIASQVAPCVRLTHVFRQASRSLIIENAHLINKGRPPVVERDENADFFVIERKDPVQARATVLELVRDRIPRRFGLDPVRDIQVLTPMHRGDAGATALNEALQATLNPRGDSFTRGARVFRLGDKVMQLRNDYEKDVWNGDLGIVSAVDAESDEPIAVRFDDGRERTYTVADLDDLTLAYASTIHKSQGSEYPAVIVVMLSSHFVMLSRNLLYTAVTRGKRLVVLVADGRALGLALRRAQGERRSRLAERLAARAVGKESWE
ncbi:MAG TPA: ATP-dependent RecD-like DNA helicase [Polyangiaceae bacterium]|nr:ATP-dependent RecD-like DNA helicase [Polyangiaceae bacterium]